MDPPAASAGATDPRLLEAAQRQLDALRSAIDARLAELEGALADPERAAALPGLVLELSRLSTSEAQAAAQRACLQVQYDSEATLLEQDARSSAALEAERKTSAELRRSLEQVQKRLDVVETEKHSILESARDQALLIENERTARGELDRTITRLERQLEEVLATSTEAQDAARRAETSGAEAHERAELLEQRSAELQVRLTREEQANRDLMTERVKNGDRIAELELQVEEHEAARAALQRTLSEERAQSKAYAGELERQLADVRLQISAGQDELSQARQERAAAVAAAEQAAQDRSTSGGRISDLEQLLEQERQWLATEQDTTRSLLAARAEADAKVASLEQAAADGRLALEQLQATLDARTRELVEAMAAATRETDVREARERALDEQARLLEHASKDADDLRRQLAERTRELGDERRTLSDLEKQLASERAISTDLRAAVNEAHTAVDGEQETLESLRRAASDAEVRMADLRSAQATLQASHDALARDLDAERRRATEASGGQDELARAHADLERTHAELQQAHADARAALDAERAAAADLRNQASGSANEREALLREVERLTAAHAELDTALAAERSRALTPAPAEIADGALQQVQTDAATLRERLAAVESSRAGVEESLIDLQERVGLVEHERDTLSLALDTERMMSADLRAAVAQAEKRAAESDKAAADLRHALEQARLDPALRAPAADEEGEVTELSFDEDAEPADGAITIGESGWEDVRMFTRYTFTSRVDIKVNSAKATLIDLSVGGCGIRTTTVLKKGDDVRVSLPGEHTPLLCLGKVIWLRDEPAAGKLPAGYRVGIQFTQSDESALEAFIIMRADL